MSVKGIGIDLGTTHSCVAVYHNEKADVVENDHGLRTTPSFVAFTENERFVGSEAKMHTCIDPANTIFDAKRMIGRTFDSQCLKIDISRWPFTVTNVNGKPRIRVMYKNEICTFAPEEISAMILSKMKEIAEEKIGEEVKDVVITVPAYFNDSQRQATKDAAKIAGLNVLKLINEPTAAALAFLLSKGNKHKGNVLVFDLGGGTFDVSVLSILNGSITVKAVNGNPHLGGSDFDCQLVEYFVAEIKEKFNRDLKQEKYKDSLARLRCECETAKKTLSGRLEAKIRIASLFDGTDFVSSIGRAKFEELCKDLFRLTLLPLENALKDAEMSKDDIDDILLVGGSTRIPMVQTMLQNFFGGKQLNKSVNPDEAVACGAAIQASLLQPEKDAKIANLSICDVVPLSYGIRTLGGLFSVIIPRNHQYPLSITEFDFTTFGFQSSALIEVYQGERPLCKDNHYLGEFLLTGLPMPWHRQAEIHVTMKIDVNGILQVSAVEASTGVRKSIKIENANGQLSQQQIDEYIEKAERMKKEDEMLKKTIEARNKLQILTFDLSRSVGEDFSGTYESFERRSAVKMKVEETLKWLKDNPDASLDRVQLIFDQLMMFKNVHYL